MPRALHFKVIHADGTNLNGKRRPLRFARPVGGRGRTGGRRRHLLRLRAHTPYRSYKYDLPRGGRPGAWSRKIPVSLLRPGGRGYYTYTLKGLSTEMVGGLNAGERVFLVEGRGSAPRSVECRAKSHGRWKYRHRGQHRHRLDEGIGLWGEVRLVRDVTALFRNYFGDTRRSRGRRWRLTPVGRRVRHIDDLLEKIRMAHEALEEEMRDSLRKERTEAFRRALEGVRT